MIVPSPASALAFAALLSSCAASRSPEVSQMPATSAPTITYPVTRMGDVVDDYHGTQVADPYRWLEDSDSPETRAWIDAQNALTEGVLTQVPERDALRQRLTALWDYPRSSVPYRKGGRTFVTRNDGLQNHGVLFVRDSAEAVERPLIDPNALSDDGTVSLSGTWVSKDGSLLVYAVSDAGTDWKTFRVRDVNTGEDLNDELRWIKFSGAAWKHDNSGFYYSRYDEPSDPDSLESINYFQKVYFHQLGTDQSEDTLVFERPDQKEWGFGTELTDDGDTLIISISEGTERKNRVLTQDLTQPDSPVVELIMEFDAAYWLVGHDGPVLWFHTDLDAPNGRVIAVDTRAPERENWKELIPEQAESLERVGVVGERFVARYLKHAKAQVRAFALDGTPMGEIALPGIGSVWGFGGEPDDRDTFFLFSSYTTPGQVYHHDLDTGVNTPVGSPEGAGAPMNPDDWEVKQQFFTSKDGTRVPMFLVHRKGLELDGSNPTYLYGYGGFRIPITPSYSAANRVWLELGGVLAIANLRGGGEYGADWHDAGRLANKQNVFDDLHSAAEWLIAEGYTSTPKLAIGGRSNGGLLVGAAITQRPDLYGAALPGVGVMDMLRFHKFTIGWAWVSDYGSSDDPEQFEWLHAYSPLHNLRPDTHYPATMVTTGDHDDRVVPGHSFKFAAALQAHQAGPAPSLIRIDTRAGHGAGKPTAMRIEEWTDSWAFLVQELDITLPSDFPSTNLPAATAPTESP